MCYACAMLLPQEDSLLLGLRSLALEAEFYVDACGILEIRNGARAGVWRFREGQYTFTPVGSVMPTITTPDFFVAIEIGTGREVFTIGRGTTRIGKRRLSASHIRLAPFGSGFRRTGMRLSTT